MSLGNYAFFSITNSKFQSLWSLSSLNVLYHVRFHYTWPHYAVLQLKLYNTMQEIDPWSIIFWYAEMLHLNKKSRRKKKISLYTNTDFLHFITVIFNSIKDEESNSYYLSELCNLCYFIPLMTLSKYFYSY